MLTIIRSTPPSPNFRINRQTWGTGWDESGMVYRIRIAPSADNIIIQTVRARREMALGLIKEFWWGPTPPNRA
jgi:hypothetical protein